MSRWVRLWEDMPNDPKWRVVRYRALQSVTDVSVCTVVGIFAYMLAKADKNGDLVNWCDEDVAAALELKTEQVAAIFEAMQGKVLDGNHLKGWNNRQPQREDNSTERVKAFRSRCNDMKRNETHVNAPEEKRLESESKKDARAREGFSNGSRQKEGNGSAAGHYVEWDTPQWNAWEEFYRTTYGKSPPKDAKGGWMFPAEWPPPTSSEPSGT